MGFLHHPGCGELAHRCLAAPRLHAPCSVVHTDIAVFNRKASNIEKEFIPSIRRLKFCLRSATSSREDQRIIVHSMLFHRKKLIGFVLRKIFNSHCKEPSKNATSRPNNDMVEC